MAPREQVFDSCDGWTCDVFERPNGDYNWKMHLKSKAHLRMVSTKRGPIQASIKEFFSKVVPRSKPAVNEPPQDSLAPHPHLRLPSPFLHHQLLSAVFHPNPSHVVSIPPPTAAIAQVSISTSPALALIQDLRNIASTVPSSVPEATNCGPLAFLSYGPDYQRTWTSQMPGRSLIRLSTCLLGSGSRNRRLRR